MLQLMVRRLRQTNIRIQRRQQPPAVKLVSTLVNLAESYGQPTEKGTEIYNVPYQDLADITDISAEDTAKIMEKLESKGWIKVDSRSQTLYLINTKQLTNIAGRS
jgi:CRP-like cAMP-binding protein